VDFPQVAGVGGVLSADIAVPEHERVSRFYARILTTGSRPLWRDDLMNSEGVPIIGLGERKPTHADLPLQWIPHIQVADVASSAERALRRGGGELMRQEDDHWAVLSDPNGAAFGIIPEVASEAVPPIEGGCIAWLDLTVPDAAHIRDFYQEVVGWSAEDVAMEDAEGRYADYALRTPDGTAVAGVCHARGVNRDLPPVWLICLPVGDLSTSLVLAGEEGGRVVDARQDGAGTYTYAVVRDPVGACLALVPG
jgi:predicted enzyme related to lactoylglutathione lyase